MRSILMFAALVLVSVCAVSAVGAPFVNQILLPKELADHVRADQSGTLAKAYFKALQYFNKNKLPFSVPLNSSSPSGQTTDVPQWIEGLELDDPPDGVYFFADIIESKDVKGAVVYKVRTMAEKRQFGENEKALFWNGVPVISATCGNPCQKVKEKPAPDPKVMLIGKTNGKSTPVVADDGRKGYEYSPVSPSVPATATRSSQRAVTTGPIEPGAREHAIRDLLSQRAHARPGPAQVASPPAPESPERRLIARHRCNICGVEFYSHPVLWEENGRCQEGDRLYEEHYRQYHARVVMVEERRPPPVRIIMRRGGYYGGGYGGYGYRHPRAARQAPVIINQNTFSSGGGSISGGPREGSSGSSGGFSGGGPREGSSGGFSGSGPREGSSGTTASGFSSRSGNPFGAP